MNLTLFRSMRFRSLMLSAFLLAASQGSAQEKKPYAKNGFYLGVAVPCNLSEGSFDGETLLTGGIEFM